jgi:DNA polymerase kappa
MSGHQPHGIATHHVTAAHIHQNHVPPTPIVTTEIEKKEAIQRIIASLSNSTHKKGNGEEAALELKAKVDSTTVTQDIRARVQSMINSLNNKRKQRICVVLDFDMFYAAVELLAKPHLADKPVAISGGNGETMTTTANYVARRYGIHSNMPIFIAKQLCKRAAEFGMPPMELTVLTQSKEKQQELSAKAMDIFRMYDPTMVHKPDEAKLELGPHLLKTSGELSFSKAEVVVQEIRSKVLAATGLTVSAGIAPNFLIGKVSSDYNKPNGQCMVKDEDIESFLRDLPLCKMHGIGPITEFKLRVAFGITTCGELRTKLPEIFAVGFVPQMLLRKSIGWCDEVNKPPGPQKSMGKGETFRATSDATMLLEILSQLCEELATEMQKDKVFAQTATLKCETKGYVPITKSETFKNVRSASDLKMALAPHLPKLSLRFMRVSVTRLQPVPKRTLDQYFLTG